jgi:hypothetical protein
MTSPGFLDFFVLEAGEYIEQLDGIILRGGTDLEALVRSARALRGSATMAKLTPFADLAVALERVGRALHGGTVAWSPAVAGALTAAVDDLKILLRAARSWTPADDQRVAARTAELTRLAPAPKPVVHGATPTASSGGSFFAAESANIAAGLELLATRPDDRDAASNVLRRVRALRGVAGIKDVPLLAQVMEGAEVISKPLELGDGPLTPERIALLRAAAVLLRRIATALREGEPADAPSAERDAFFSALESFQERERGNARIVPITELFYTDGGPHVVSAAPHPPTTPAERFRLEVVSQGEHLRGLVVEARGTADVAGRERVRRELRQALGDLRRDAQSFGESEVADLISAHLDAVKSLDALALNSLEGLAQVLASPGAQGERLAARLSQLKVGRTVDASIGEGMAAATPVSPAPRRVSSTAPTPVITPAIRADARSPAPNAAAPGGGGRPSLLSSTDTTAPRAPAAGPPLPSTSPLPPTSMPRPTPSGARSLTPGGSQRVSTPRDTMAVLDQGIDSLSSLAARPMSDPVELGDQPLVPIDALLYRGRAAIERAIELREQIRRHGGAASPDTLGELFDLLDLALAE